MKRTARRQVSWLADRCPITTPSHTSAPGMSAGSCSGGRSEPASGDGTPRLQWRHRGGFTPHFAWSPGRSSASALPRRQWSGEYSTRCSFCCVSSKIECLATAPQEPELRPSPDEDA
jgi:hypothetical protein